MHLKRNCTKILICICMCLLPQITKADGFVTNVTEFKIHTTNHIQNVYRLGMYMHEQYPEEFGDVPKELLREKLLMHDYEKLASISELKKMGYMGKRPFYELLYQHFGENVESTENPEPLKNLIQILNRYGKLYENEFYKRHGLINPDGTLNEIGKKIKRIEKISDVVEREMNFVTPDEVGLPEAKKATVYLKRRIDRSIARSLARDYFKVAKLSPLVKVPPIKINIPSCARLFN